MFSNKKKDSLSEAIAPSSGKTEAPAGATSVHGFDPAALERAAKAARELDGSKNAKDALKLIMTQESTKQKEQETERAKYVAMQEELRIRRVQEEERSAQEMLNKQTEHEKQRALMKDELERKRMVDQINAQRHMQEEERRKSEESLRRQEEIRRKTLEYEAELRQQTEMARVKAETEGKIKQERVNHDLVLDNKRLEAKELRETVLESIKLAGTTIGTGVMEFVSDREKLTNVAVTLTGVAFGLYAAKVSTGVAGRVIEARLGKPSLVRETTRKNFLANPFYAVKAALSKANPEAALDKVVLENTLAGRLQRIAKSTANTKKNKAPFRHLLLHGPPGVGKTMFAKKLASASNLHYAIMTGGDIAPLGKDAVTEIHKIFDWANTTDRGVLIFVDEADAFLRKRSTEKISEDMRNALNAFLYRTGEASKKFMVVYASNQPEQFDWAINDRIDEMVEFKLPGLEERQRMIVQYMDEYLINNTSGNNIIVKDVTEEQIHHIAKETDGYSGREICKLAIAWQAAAFGTEDATLTYDMLVRVLEESKLSKVQKENWLRRERVQLLTNDAN